MAVARPQRTRKKEEKGGGGDVAIRFMSNAMMNRGMNVSFDLDAALEFGTRGPTEKGTCWCSVERYSGCCDGECNTPTDNGEGWQSSRMKWPYIEAHSEPWADIRERSGLQPTSLARRSPKIPCPLLAELLHSINHITVCCLATHVHHSMSVCGVLQCGCGMYELLRRLCTW